MSLRRTGNRLRRPALAALALAMTIAAAQGETLNGFDLRGALVPPDEILAGGPPIDGIPAIDVPRFVTAGEATFLGDSDTVLGVARQGIAKAYPIRIMNWHEVVNDRFGSEAVVVTFCPLCGSGVAFLAAGRGARLDFGVSGLLYNSDVLLYDRQTRSLWSQLAMRAVSGPRRGERLAPLPTAHTTWREWRWRHPATLVLSADTGHARDYARDPYAGYAADPATLFPVKFRALGLHPKERVLGVEVAGRFKAYPFIELGRAAAPVRDRLGGADITVRYDAAAHSAEATGPGGEPLAAVTLFWFAWAAFHPDTEVYRAGP